MQQVEPEKPHRRDAGDRRGDGDPDRRQCPGRTERQPEHAQPGMKPAIEQDEGDRGAADEIGGAGIADFEPEPIMPGGHTKPKEGKKQGRADPGRKHAGENPGEQEQRAYEYELMRLLHVPSARFTSCRKDIAMKWGD